MWSNFILRVTCIQSYHPVDSEKDEPCYNNYGKTPIKIDWICPVNGYPT